MEALRTWDGEPVSAERPYGASVVVWRRGAGKREFLVLHRRHAGGADFEGDWAWTPPSGARLPGEALHDAACRELLEEAGLELAFEPSDLGSEEWAVFVAEAPADARVVLDEEHDRFVWLPAAEAAAKCLPPLVGRTLLAVDEWLDQRQS
jgi:8-oxo-dGTP pyrophosphatase MutT (NUDIX family)